ncbi:MAG: NADH-quinone oxidoreductase subunit L [Kiritimatiellae bacterium]|nr:NADH-quinone oxidoreductase subunit L [Kiritimatiellia bacterium]
MEVMGQFLMSIGCCAGSRWAALAEHPLVMPIVFPFLAGLVCLLLPRKLDRERANIAVFAAALTLLLVWPLFAGGHATCDFGRWVSLRVDALSGFVLLATAGFGLLIAVYSYRFLEGKPRLREYYAYLLWTLGASLGAVMANDLILLLVFWGFLALTLYLMIGLAGPDASSAAKKSFIIIGGSDSVLLMGVAVIWVMTGSTRMNQAALPLNTLAANVAFLAILAAAFAKAGAMPLHTWVPDCGEKAWIPVTAFLPASLDKLLGIYLLARAATGMFAMNFAMGTLLMFLGAVTVMFAVMMALVQHDMKRLLSYHAVSQVGYMVLGIGTGTPIGIAGGLFHMLNHAIYKSCLFLCAGSVEKAAGTSDLDKLGGLARTLPITFVAFTVAALSISGIPPMNGFASKWMVYQGVIESGRSGSQLWVVWLAAAMLGSALTLASFVKVLHAAFLRRPAPELAGKSVREGGMAMRLPVSVLAVLCVLFGVGAHRIPLKHMILPAVGKDVSYLGVWWAGPATAMLVAGFLIGFVIYFLTTVRQARVCPTYVGGELLGETHIRGEPTGPARDVEVTGVEFYRTVQEIGVLRGLYGMAEKKLFDVYDVGIRVIFYFVEALRRAHSGLLPVYLTWVLVGLLAIMYALMRVWG